MRINPLPLVGRKLRSLVFDATYVHVLEGTGKDMTIGSLLYSLNT